MQATLYYRDEDDYLSDLVDREAERRRTSRSAVIMAILEKHFEREKRLGEILVDMGIISPENVRAALEHQQSGQHRGQSGRSWLREGLQRTRRSDGPSSCKSGLGEGRAGGPAGLLQDRAGHDRTARSRRWRHAGGQRKERGREERSCAQANVPLPSIQEGRWRAKRTS